MSARETRATRELQRGGVAHRVHEYSAPERHGPARDERPAYGLEAASALGIAPARIFKTLVARVDDRLALAIVPVAGSLDLKALATALGGHRAELAAPDEAERATGYVVGGISPFGTRRRLPVALDASATSHVTVLVSAGRRGLQVELTPEALVRATGASIAPIGR